MLQVYLGKWQETDVAIKVLMELPCLAPNSLVLPRQLKASDQEVHNFTGTDVDDQQVKQSDASASGTLNVQAGEGAERAPPVVSEQEMQAITMLEREVHVLLSYCQDCCGACHAAAACLHCRRHYHAPSSIYQKQAAGLADIPFVPFQCCTWPLCVSIAAWAQSQLVRVYLQSSSSSRLSVPRDRRAVLHMHHASP